MSKLDESKKKRFQFLNNLYEITGGSSRKIVNLFDLGTELGFEREETNNIVQYLKGEHLIDHKTMGGGIIITHYGVKEVEEALSHPETPTTFFPPVNIIQIHHMEGSQIQQGVINSSQTASFDFKNSSALQAFISELQESIPKLSLTQEESAEVSADAATIDSQLKSSKPKVSILKECLHSIRNILEGATGSILAAGLLEKIPPLLLSLGN